MIDRTRRLPLLLGLALLAGCNGGGKAHTRASSTAAPSSAATTPVASTTPGVTPPPPPTPPPPTPPPAPPRPTSGWVFTANYASGTVSAFRFDAATGVLSQGADTPLAPGTNAIELGVDAPTGTRAVFVCQYGQVQPLALDRATGALTLGAAATTPGTAYGVASDPAGFFYAANYTGTAGAGTVSQFSFVPGGARLTPLAPPSVTSGGLGAAYVALDRARAWLYAVNNGDSTVQAYTRANGGLVLNGAAVALPGAAGANCCVVDPAGAFLYVGDSRGSIYTIPISATGALGAPRTPFRATGAASVFDGVKWIDLDPTGRLLISANTDGGDVGFFTVNAGALTRVPGTPLPAAYARACAFEPGGKFAYFADFGASAVLAYEVTATGVRAVPGSPFPMPQAGDSPYGIAVGE